MTQHARVVLSDCNDAISDLTADLGEATWRRRWVTVLTLLRAVGHVLDRPRRHVVVARPPPCARRQRSG
jgi:hypothetical protein